MNGNSGTPRGVLDTITRITAGLRAVVTPGRVAGRRRGLSAGKRG